MGKITTKTCLHVLTFMTLVTLALSKALYIQSIGAHDDLHDYLAKRAAVLQSEKQMGVGGKISLTPQEQRVNKILLNLKVMEINSSVQSGGNPYPPHLHFFTAKNLIEKSAVFNFIKMMPKGGALHLHDVSLLSLDWLVKNVTYRENCYMCSKTGARILFKFSKGTPKDADCTEWTLVKTNRAKSDNPQMFDQWLYNNMSLVVDDPEMAYPTQDVVWQEFEGALHSASGLIWHAPVFKDYLYQALQEYNDDNVQYIEIRTLMTESYELDGTMNSQLWSLEAFRNVSMQFVKDQQGVFFGSKVIYSDIRYKGVADILKSVKNAVRWREMFPDFMVGYDLVGQEDHGKPLLFYIQDLLRNASQTALPYFFHAGETDWEGTLVDDNLIDAILLNTSRIGHGFAIDKHPWVMAQILSKAIAVEVNPISNQVLKLVDDMRDHPATSFIANNLPVVISADDPSVWGAKGLSYDFYEAFMGLSREDAGLALLKQLAINSIQYSAMSEAEKTTAMNLWQTKWNKFLDDVIHLFHPETIRHVEYNEFVP